MEAVCYLAVSFWFTKISLALDVFLQPEGELSLLAPSGLCQHQKIAESNVSVSPRTG